MGTLDMNEELDAERAALVLERQERLEGILNRHDNLVREAYHMEKWVTLLSYDPQVAKQDNSEVFKQFQSSYDLLDKAPGTSGPSRRTRKAQTERLQVLKGQSTGNPASISKKSPRAKFNGKASFVEPPNTAIWNILASAKGKGKERVKDHSRVGENYENITSEDPEGLLESISSGPFRNFRKTKRPHSSTVSSLDPPKFSVSDDEEPVSGHLNGSPRKKRRKAFHSSPGDPPSTGLSATPPSIRKRNHDGPHLRLMEKKSRTAPSRVSSRLISQVPDVSFPTHPSALQERSNVTENDTQTSLLIPKSPIKRIRLLVRPPPPSYSNPRQRPPPPQYKNSLSAFISSYIMVEDQDITEAATEEMAKKEGALRDKIDELRKEGKLTFASSALPEMFSGLEGKRQEPTRRPAVWDCIVESVILRGRVRRHRGRYIASQIASKITAYWEGQALRKDKIKAQEERRLRALAKATIKLVTTEWKKAVFHIREQERQKLEAEEMRRGHEHLDAILDQSGYILETQQVDLTKGDTVRSRSRSSSASAPHDYWASEESSSDELDGKDEEDELRENADVLVEREEVELDGEDAGDDVVDADGGFEEDPSDMVDVNADPPTPATPGESMLESVKLEDEDMDTEEDNDDVEEEIRDQEHDNISEISATGISELDENRSRERDNPRLDSDPEDSITMELLGHVRSPSRSRSSYPPIAETHLDRSNRDFISPASTPSNTLLGSPAAHTEDGLHVNGKVPADLIQTASAGDEAGDEKASSTSPVAANESLKASALSPDKQTTAGEDPQAGHDVDETTVPNLVSASKNDEGVSSEPQVISNPGEQSTVEEDKPDAETEGMQEQVNDERDSIPEYLKPYAVAPVEWHPESKVKPPLLLRGVLRPYQQSGLEWLASLHVNNLNGILADEMGLGKTIQTISLLAHLACDRGIWGPHLIIVPTSVLLNWEMEFKKFLPGFKILSYHGNTKRRKELRQGWNDKHHFNVCITSYTLASRDAHIFKRRPWYYMILDEAHMIKNFKSQRWNILLMFRSFRRLLLTGTPLQNNLTELWALLQFLMSGSNFANLKEFGEWFSNPLEKAIEMGSILDDETMQRVSKLHTVLRPYLLRRLKRDVEKELPSKYEHLVLCPLSKRQRFLYDEFMSRAHTRESLQSGVYQKIANVLMQLRKVCNHPDLFEVRPIVTSFAMEKSAVSEYEIKELLIRRSLLNIDQPEEILNLEVLGLRFIDSQGTPLLAALESRRLDASSHLPFIAERPGEPPPADTRTIAGFRTYQLYQRRAQTISKWAHIGYLNFLRCSKSPVYSSEMIHLVRQLHRPILPVHSSTQPLESVSFVKSAVKSYLDRAEECSSLLDKFAFVTPAVVARDLPDLVFSGCHTSALEHIHNPQFDAVVHRSAVKLQIAFPDPSLLQYDCGKLQELTRLLREKKAGGHRVLIFTQMTKILDILETFLNFHGYLYLRLDGATKIEDRQYITERFNADSRVFCFIASSRSGGVGINLTGADTVIFYDSDFNPQMDRQCEDRAHRIGQIRDVHIYRFISQHTVEEALLRKANQKRSLDELVIQKGEFDWRTLFGDEAALTQALGEVEDREDAHAAVVAAREEIVMEGADEADFGADMEGERGEVVHGEVVQNVEVVPSGDGEQEEVAVDEVQASGGLDEEPEEVEDEGGTTVDYMLAFVQREYDFFRDWRL